MKVEISIASKFARPIEIKDARVVKIVDNEDNVIAVFMQVANNGIYAVTADDPGFAEFLSRYNISGGTKAELVKVP